MRAALLSEYHKDFVVDTVPDPEITAPDDVIVRVGAAGFCRTDIHMWDGQFDAMQKGAGVDLPFICGHENAGWVAEVGAGVHHLSVGDAVLLHPMATCGYCHFCRAGEDMHCTDSFFPGILAPGGFAEYVRTNARAVVPLPAGLTRSTSPPSATRASQPTTR
jgi:NAD+-dependent secondary alcohol dehydrogenase Adh1